jgi:hypothetical protein
LEIDVNTASSVTLAQGTLLGVGAIAGATTSASTLLSFSGAIGAGGVNCSGVGLNNGTISGPVTVQTSAVFTNYYQANNIFTVKGGSTYMNVSGATITYAAGTSVVQTNGTFINAGMVNGDVINNQGTVVDTGIAAGAGMTLTSLGNQGGGLFIPGNASTNATVIDSSGLTLFPGAALLAQGSTTVFKIDVTHATNTVLRLVHLSFGGSSTTRNINGCTLELDNISGSPFAAGQSYHLFDNKGSSGTAPYDTGTSTNTYPVITPATPGAGLAWDMSQLWLKGNIGVVAANAGPTLTNSFTLVDGTNQIAATFSWDASYLGYRLQSLSTGLTNGLAANNWSTFSGSWTNLSATFTNTIDVSNGASVFYRLVFP